MAPRCRWWKMSTAPTNGARILAAEAQMGHDSQMSDTPTIRRLTISRFRGVESLVWCPTPATNIILGGGDVGKTTVLEAIALLFNPSSSAVVTETDYWRRDTSVEFSIEAVMMLPPDFGINTQQQTVLPWHWDGADGVLPAMTDDLPETDNPVYKVRVRGTPDLELLWEIVQPNGEAAYFSAGLRRNVGLVRLPTEDRNDRDLRLVFGSALDRLLDDAALRPKIGKQVAELDLAGSLGASGKTKLAKLDEKFAEIGLPRSPSLGLTTTQGLSIGALIGLLAEKDGVVLPLASWGAGTRRMAALEIASLAETKPGILTVDEIERGLEPYRLRKLIKELIENQRQSFITTHSPAAIAYSEGAQLWFMDAKSKLGQLDKQAIAQQQLRDPETFLARFPVIAEGVTEVGFLNYLLEAAFRGDPRDHGVRVCNGQGNEAVLGLLEAVAKGGLKFAALVDDEGLFSGRWKALKATMGDGLLQWTGASTERVVFEAIDDDKLDGLLRDNVGNPHGERLRTLATRLGILDKDLASIRTAAQVQGVTLRNLMISAATGSKEGASAEDEKAWKAHGRTWFKHLEGGRELADKMKNLGAWPEILPKVLPLLNRVLAAADKPALEHLDL